LGLIEILDHEKDEIIAKLESDLKTLETKNLELKYTNRNLISTVSEQKKKLKVLKAKFEEIKSIKNHPAPNNIGELKTKYQKLLADHEDLKAKYEASKKELEELKNTDSDTKSGQGLFGRLLKRTDTDRSHEDSEKESKK
jgi:predicted RNase H-like nuclease (RuvC/YqgF family)